MSWWQWTLVIWLASGPVVLLVLAVIDWWCGRSLDREWRRFNRQQDLAHRDVRPIR